MSLYSLDYQLQVLEPLASQYLGRDRVLSLTPLLAA
jgi:hypothetical protein